MRIGLFDSIRGLTIVSMVCFHASYDACYLYGIDAFAWFDNPVIQSVWRITISWTFLLLAGWMATLSRNNLRRGLIYAAAAVVVCIATTVASIDAAVNFGILYCMAACTLLYALCKPLFQHIPCATGLVCSVALFTLTYQLPLTRYPFEGLAWLGLPSYTFISGDYYPLLPYLFLYLAGAFAARKFEELHRSGYPKWMLNTNIPLLSNIGKLSLPVYLAHQPLLIVIFTIMCSSQHITLP